MSMLGFMFASRRVLRAALFLAPAVYFQTLQISSQLNANRALARTHDQLLAAAIYDRIARVSPECTVGEALQGRFLWFQAVRSSLQARLERNGRFFIFRMGWRQSGTNDRLYATDRIYQPCAAYGRRAPSACPSLPNYARLARGRIGAPCRTVPFWSSSASNPGMCIETWCTANVVRHRPSELHEPAGLPDSD